MSTLAKRLYMAKWAQDVLDGNAVKIYINSVHAALCMNRSALFSPLLFGEQN